MNHSIDQQVTILQKDPQSLAVEDFIKSYYPLMASSAAKRLQRYILVEGDEGFAVALEGFRKAFLTYDETKGSFVAFAKLLMDHELINHLKKEQKPPSVSLTTLPLADPSLSMEETMILREEIQALEEGLGQFGLTFDTLAAQMPKHEDTKKRARDIAYATYEEKELLQEIFQKCTLPVTKMALRFGVSRKLLYGSRPFIISILIVLKKKLEHIKKWL